MYWACWEPALKQDMHKHNPEHGNVIEAMWSYILGRYSKGI